MMPEWMIGLGLAIQVVLVIASFNAYEDAQRAPEKIDAHNAVRAFGILTALSAISLVLLLGALLMMTGR